jgi:hypothetical protein
MHHRIIDEVELIRNGDVRAELDLYDSILADQANGCFQLFLERISLLLVVAHLAAYVDQATRCVSDLLFIMAAIVIESVDCVISRLRLIRTRDIGWLDNLGNDCYLLDVISSEEREGFICEDYGDSLNAYIFNLRSHSDHVPIVVDEICRAHVD